MDNERGYIQCPWVTPDGGRLPTWQPPAALGAPAPSSLGGLNGGLSRVLVGLVESLRGFGELGVALIEVLMGWLGILACVGELGDRPCMNLVGWVAGLVGGGGGGGDGSEIWRWLCY